MGAIAPTAASVTVMTPPDAMLPHAAIDLVEARLARRTGATTLVSPAGFGTRSGAALSIETGISVGGGATSQTTDWEAGDLISRPTGELPMRAVTVGDPKGTGDVRTYMPGPRNIYLNAAEGSPTDILTNANRPPNVVIGRTPSSSILTGATTRSPASFVATYDHYQFPAYVLSDADAVSAIELHGDRRVTVKLGGADGQGLAFNDMKLPVADRTGTLPATFSRSGIILREWNEKNHGDLTIAFGKDAYGPDPHGDGAHYWRADVEFDAENAGVDGAYQLWLSNQAGSVSASADDAEYLRYAAYGLFNFMDGTLDDAVPVGGGDAYTPVSARLQGLHFGLDTPEGGATDSIASLRALGTSIGATWSGRTTALAMLTTGERGVVQRCQSGVCVDRSFSISGNGIQQSNPPALASMRRPTEALLRMRGDVKLYACFGASGTCSITGAPDADELRQPDVMSNADPDPANSTRANFIEGVMNNFEAFVGGEWRATESDGTAPDDAFHIGEIHLVSTPIDASGAFGLGVGTTAYRDTNPVGKIVVDNNEQTHPRFIDDIRGYGADNLRWAGAWGGRFYGPATDADGPAEAAGWWFLPGDNENHALHTIVGSFGAVRD